MFQIIFALLLLFALLALVRALTQAAPGSKNRSLGYTVLGLFCLLLLLLVVSGRLHILVALGAALIPILKQLPRWLPHLLSLKDTLGRQRNKGAGEANKGDGEATKGRNGTFGRDEACVILGLGSNPDKAEVLEAHRRLIQKVHPDRGGSEYLASRINEARDILLSSFK